MIMVYYLLTLNIFFKYYIIELNILRFCEIMLKIKYRFKDLNPIYS